MIDTATQVISMIVILLALVLAINITQFIRRRRDLFTLRRIPAYETLPMMVGQSIESNRPLHLSLGSAGIGGEKTLLAIASAELAYQMAQQAAIGDTSPILTVASASALPLGQDTLRRAYQSRGLRERYDASSIRWYPAGTRSLAFAAALTAMQGDDRVSGNILVGSFGPELALILDASNRRQVASVAASDQLEGQAVAYALTENPLIGEEIFASASYLGGEPAQIAETVTLDVLRWVVVAAIVFLFIAGIVEG